MVKIDLMKVNTEFMKRRILVLILQRTFLNEFRVKLQQHLGFLLLHQTHSAASESKVNLLK